MRVNKIINIFFLNILKTKIICLNSNVLYLYNKSQVRIHEEQKGISDFPVISNAQP